MCEKLPLVFVVLTTYPFAVRRLLAFDQCVTITFLRRDCMKQVQKGVCSVDDEMLFSVVGSILWGITGFFHLFCGICAQTVLFISYQPRVCRLLKLMFAGDIVFFRRFAVSTMTHVHCDTKSHVRFQSAAYAQRCTLCQRCQMSTISRFLLSVSCHS